MKLGFLINPIAGMGGRVGLKGTDNIAKNAMSIGAKPIAPARAKEFLNKLKTLEFKEQLEIITCPAPMGRRRGWSGRFFC